MTTANLYLQYLYSSSGTARREFLDALATEETDALVGSLNSFNRDNSADGVPVPDLDADGRVK